MNLFFSCSYSAGDFFPSLNLQLPISIKLLTLIKPIMETMHIPLMFFNLAEEIFESCPQKLWASLVAQTVKNPPAMQETWVQSLGWEDPLEEGMATHSSILA